ncbi:LytTR family two component transcriptional regulator [Algoriphagus ratkowskyi]|uniref:LytTR family two component transcriptional regulator n=1 Tax=Algoriphagus ratkowskyi TaxID=57028 RepID=A0A2W7RJ59_9BACT|nr:LytTR family DNA-binding domain-containing protein [Algoriphagus ratkowskyi]PZX60424.1 LytTR family two component transcriptional regulator [Algoriphagus ratkowskyi]TXD78234.1 response regulator transcription factor [Algoriphagus ratkowskyi]
MNCIVVDDESVSREILTFLCNQEPNLEVVGAFNNAMDAFIFLNKEQVDLIFLDIHMPGFSGFDFIQTLKSSSQIILTTSDKESALKAFEYDNIVAFLIKPIDPERFKKAVQKARKNLPHSHNLSPNIPNVSSQFYINIDKRLIKLNSEEVNMIEAKGDYILIHLDNTEYRVHTTLSKIKSKLPHKSFFQVHRSYIINLSKIIDIQDNTILIQKFVIPISRSRRPELMKKLNLV